ncbi:MAG: hypothetical protein CSB49_07540 [Proteobacteria bacterium]|nr:MAG: hypothetical protein CSB49_07540 [Pseudomonadota bacterium]
MPFEGRVDRKAVNQKAVNRKAVNRKGTVNKSAIRRRVVHRRYKPLPAPRLGAARTVGWGAGEQMTFEARLGPLLVGRAALAIGRPKGTSGRQIIAVRGRSEPIPSVAAFYKLSEELVTTVDLGGVLPLRSRLTATKGSRVTRTTTQHGTTRRPLTQQWVKRGKLKPYLRRRRVPRDHHDPLTALLALRSIPLIPGQHVKLTLVTGRKSFRVEGKVLAPRDQDFKGRGVSCLGLSGVVYQVTDSGRVWRGKRRRRFMIWVSNDRRRIPITAELQTKFGTIDVNLTSYRRARRPLRVRPVALR